VIYENELSEGWDWPDDTLDVSVPVSMIRYPTGEMDMVVLDLTAEAEHEHLAERRVRFSARAAAQFLDAIGSHGQPGYILFGDERPVNATLH